MGDSQIPTQVNPGFCKAHRRRELTGSVQATHFVSFSNLEAIAFLYIYIYIFQATDL